MNIFKKLILSSLVLSSSAVFSGQQEDVPANLDQTQAEDDQEVSEQAENEGFFKRVGKFCDSIGLTPAVGVCLCLIGFFVNQTSGRLTPEQVESTLGNVDLWNKCQASREAETTFVDGFKDLQTRFAEESGSGAAFTPGLINDLKAFSTGRLTAMQTALEAANGDAIHGAIKQIPQVFGDLETAVQEALAKEVPEDAAQRNAFWVAQRAAIVKVLADEIDRINKEVTDAKAAVEVARKLVDAYRKKAKQERINAFVEATRQ